MRFLGVGDDNSLGDLYRQLQAAGHDVRVHVGDAACHRTLGGLITRVDDWREHLDWLREVGEDGIILFETAHDGPLQDVLRRDGFNVIGGSAFGDRLENDRAFGQQWMRAAGMQTAASHEFTSFAAAADFVLRRRRRYVFKLSGGNFPSSRNYVGIMDDGSDVLGLLRDYEVNWPGETPTFILMDHVTGVEVGIGAYFNGEDFMDPVCLDWEHKRFFEGDLGELTGEMGTLVTYRGSEALFDVTLRRMAGPLRAGGYVGYININTIVNDDGIWPLEFTCRFGYPGFAILSALHAEDWGMLFGRMIRRDNMAFATHPGYAIGVVLSVPPFPYGGAGGDLPSAAGLPILFRDRLTDQEQQHLHFDEVAEIDGRLRTTGPLGYVMVATGAGDTVQQARSRCYRLVERVAIPNLRYRRDIGMRFLEQDGATLRRLGWLD